MNTSFNYMLLMSTLSVVVLILTIILLRYYKKEIREIQAKESRFHINLQPDSISNLSNLLIQNFITLNSYYSEHLSQYSRSALASIIIAVIGFMVIIAGILAAVIGNQVTLGTVSSSAGIIAEAAAFLFFRQTHSFQVQVQDSLKKLVSTQYLMTSISIAKELDEEKKALEVGRINDHLRSLMNILHGVNGNCEVVMLNKQKA
jgi:hypothetical protein